jgi:hypothetical protein
MRTATTTAAAAAKAADDQNRLENHPLDCAMRQNKEAQPKTLLSETGNVTGLHDHARRRLR